MLIEIPTNEYNPDMLAWEGIVNEKGDINWEKPKELVKYLTKIDFKDLDFLPQGFQQTVAKRSAIPKLHNCKQENS